MSSQEILFSHLEKLQIKYDSLLLTMQKEREIKQYYESENSRLLEMLRELRRQRFGPRSERWESKEQLVFNEAEVLSKQEKPEDEGETEVKPHTRKKGKRKPLPDNLPREVVLIELPESERIGEDGKVLKPIGKEVSEKLHFEPAVMKVIEYHRIRYGADSGDTGVIAPPVASIIPKGIVTPSLLSHIVMQKFGYGMPFYRQEDMFSRMGVEIPRCTQARWVIQSAQMCRALWNILEERVLASSYVACDETWTQVLKEENKKPESKSWMWVRATPGDEKKIILFDYDPHRSGDVAKKLFTDYKGVLQVDGYGAYDALESQEGLIRIGCNMHGRRKFESALKTGAKAGHSLSEEALNFYKQIYHIEREAKELSFDDRYRLRNLKAVPVWEEFKKWADTHYPKVPPKSKIGEAFHYFINEYQYLTGYLKDGKLEADNGFCERAITNFAVGRKNWLFSDSEDGADASALYYSIVVTAKINGNDPQKVLTQIFEQIPLAKTIDDYERIADLILTRPTLH
jgi:transposase